MTGVLPRVERQCWLAAREAALELHSPCTAALELHSPCTAALELHSPCTAALELHSPRSAALELHSPCNGAAREEDGRSQTRAIALVRAGRTGPGSAPSRSPTSHSSLRSCCGGWPPSTAAFDVVDQQRSERRTEVGRLRVDGCRTAARRSGRGRRGWLGNRDGRGEPVGWGLALFAVPERGKSEGRAGLGHRGVARRHAGAVAGRVRVPSNIGRSAGAGSSERTSGDTLSAWPAREE
jgi:hypothetical protein